MSKVDLETKIEGLKKVNTPPVIGNVSVNINGQRYKVI